MPFKGKSQYEKNYYCAHCGKWIPRQQIFRYEGKIVTNDGKVWRWYVWFVCPYCLKRVRTKAFKSK
jgi:DNA-directed RNA polymerase subunit RPC12/RpoP